MEFTIKVHHSRKDSIVFGINFLKLNLKIITITRLTGNFPEGEPDTEITLDLLSGELAEIFYLAYFSGQQKATISM